MMFTSILWAGIERSYRMKTNKKTASKRMKEIKQEIEWYNIRKPIADAMIKLGELGFEFSGHGCGCGGEDFGLINEKQDRYVNFCDRGNSCEVMVNTAATYDEDGCPVTLFKGTIGKALKFIEKKKS